MKKYNLNRSQRRAINGKKGKNRKTNKTQSNSSEIGVSIKQLINKGWVWYDSNARAKVLKPESKIKPSSTLVFNGEDLTVFLEPYKDGVFLSHISVWFPEKEICQPAYIVESLINLLLSVGITKIYSHLSLSDQMSNEMNIPDHVWLDALELIGFKEVDARFYQLDQYTPTHFVNPVKFDFKLEKGTSSNAETWNSSESELKMIFEFVQDTESIYNVKFTVGSEETTRIQLALSLTELESQARNADSTIAELYTIIKRVAKLKDAEEKIVWMKDAIHLIQKFAYSIPNLAPGDGMITFTPLKTLLTAFHLVNDGFKVGTTQYKFIIDSERGTIGTYVLLPDKGDITPNKTT